MDGLRHKVVTLVSKVISLANSAYLLENLNNLSTELALLYAAVNCEFKVK